MKCMVQGTVNTKNIDDLEILLRDLSVVPKEKIRIHNLVLKSETNLGLAALGLLVLCDLEQPVRTWTVRHVEGSTKVTGAEQIMNSLHVEKIKDSLLVENFLQIKTIKNPLPFFYGLGYKFNNEVLKVGFAFRFRRRGVPITVAVTSTQKMLKLHATEEAVPVTPGIQLVDISASATADNYNEAVAAVVSLCEYLAPLMVLSKRPDSPAVPETTEATAA